MKRNFIFTAILSFGIVLTSCSGGDHPEEGMEDGENMENMDSVAQAEARMEKIEEAMAEDTMSSSGESQMQSDVKAAATEASGEVDDSGLTFCDCVKKMDKLQADLDAEEDADKIMAIMDEMEALLGGDCSVLKAKDQKSVEDQEEHKKRVAACK